MKILVISHGYAPHINPRSFRWTALCEHWANHENAQIDVVTSPAPGASEFENLNGVRVHRAGAKIGTALRTQVQTVHTAKILRAVYKSTWQKVMWPDYACLWYFPALREAERLIAENNYDWMISVSHPFTGHLIAHSIKRRHSELKWMMDIGDPFAFLTEPTPNNTWLYNSLNYRFEGQMLAKARAISVTTPLTQARYEAIFSKQAGNKITTIPPLLRRVTPGPSIRPASDAKRFTYLGTLYRNLRSPQPFLRLFANLIQREQCANFELHFYGSMNGCEDLFAPFSSLIGKNIFLYGLVPMAQAQQAAADTDFLVNLGNDSLFQLPSKTIEYAATGKPIINIASKAEDSSLEFLRSYPSLFNVIGNFDLDETTASLLTFIRTAKPVEKIWIDERLKEFSMDEVSKAYLKLLS